MKEEVECEGEVCPDEEEDYLFTKDAPLYGPS